MYRVWFEEILGFMLRGDRLTVDPVLPHNWHVFYIRFRHRTAIYVITVENPDAVCCGVLWAEVDGTRMSEHVIALHDDGANHTVIVRLGRLARTRMNGATADSAAGEA
jgi:cyclic beta-1,2-glucan synthetase